MNVTSAVAPHFVILGKRAILLTALFVVASAGVEKAEADACTIPTGPPYVFELPTGQTCTSQLNVGAGGPWTLDIYGEIIDAGPDNALFVNKSASLASIINRGTITSDSFSILIDGDDDAILPVSLFQNHGTIISSSEYFSAVKISNRTTERFENYGVISNTNNFGLYLDGNSDPLNKLNYLVNWGEISGGKAGLYTVNAQFITLENAQGNRLSRSETPLEISGQLPENYNIIVSSDGFGQLEGYEYKSGNIFEDSYLLSGSMTFGISDQSVKIKELVYEDVLLNFGDEFIVNESGGTYRGAQWSLIETDPGSWDLVFSSLPLYNPTIEQVVAVPLSARSQSFSQQFDGSRVVMHLAESRNKGKVIVPTADVIYEGEQSGDMVSTSTTIGGSTIFGIVRGAWAEFNAVGDNPQYSSDAWGMTMGAEQRFTGIDATIGVFGSYSETDSQSTSSNDNVKNIGGGIHGNKELGADIWFDGYAAYYRHGHDITRVDGADTYSADPDGRTWTAYGRLSYADWDFSGLAVTPYVAGNYVDQKLEAYEEKGAAAGALSVDEDENWNVLTYVGTTFSADLPISETVSLLPKLDVAWIHLMKDGERSVTTTFVGETDAFAATISGADQDFARVEASLGLTLDGGLAMRVDYATELGNADVESLHELRLEATYQF